MNRHPTVEEVKEGLTALSKWRQSSSAERYDLAWLIIRGRTLIGMPVEKAYSALQDSTDYIRESPGGIYYLILQQPSYVSASCLYFAVRKDKVVDAYIVENQ